MIFKKLEINNIEEMLKVQNYSTDGILYTMNDYYFFLNCINYERVIGVFDKNKLIAFSIFKKADKRDFFYIGDLFKDCVVGKCDGTIVLPEYRGKCLQKTLLKTHLDYARDNGYDAVMSYAHPENIISMNNLMFSGFKLLGKKYIEFKSQERNIFLIETFSKN